jgi:hypothetical protein
MVTIGFGASTDGSFTRKPQGSDHGTTVTELAAGDRPGAYTAVNSAAGQNAAPKTGYIGYKRCIRPAIIVSGATSGAVIRSAAILRRPSNAPV